MPFASLAGISVLISIPVILVMGHRAMTSDWVESTAYSYDFSGMQDRLRNKAPEYFYNKIYYYLQNEDTILITEEVGFSEYDKAVSDLKRAKSSNVPMTIWINNSNGDVSVVKPDDGWIPYLITILLLPFPLLYIRWLLLKYYEYELEE